MTNLKYYKLFSICLFAYLLICLSKNAYAQSLSLSIWPPLVEIMVQPGRTLNQTFEITNNSDHEMSLTPEIVSFTPKGETGEIILGASPDNSFFSFNKEPLALGIGEKKVINLKITIPKNAPENDYYSTFLFSPTEGNQTGQTLSLSRAKIGANILLTTSQTGQPSVMGRIKEFSAPLILDSFSPVNFLVRLENTGRTLWKPFGQIRIEGMLQQKKEIKLLEQNILANSSRELTLESYHPRLPLGPFKATLDFSLNESNQRAFSEVIFWYIPYKILGLIALFFLTLFLKIVPKRKLDKQ